MANKLKAIITDDQDIVKIPTGIRMLIRCTCRAVLVQEQFNDDAEVSVRLVDDATIKALNLQFRKIDKATDVLSFPLGDNGEFDTNLDTGAKMLGDIVISAERAVEQARMYGHSFKREIAFLTAHSMLHLLGYDHEQGGIDSVRMREKEETVLDQLGLPRGSNYVLR